MEFLTKKNELSLCKELLSTDQKLLKAEKEALYAVTEVYHENLMGDIALRRNCLEAMSLCRKEIKKLTDEIKAKISTIDTLFNELNRLQDKLMGRE